MMIMIMMMILDELAINKLNYTWQHRIKYRFTFYAFLQHLSHYYACIDTVPSCISYSK